MIHLGIDYFGEVVNTELSFWPKLKHKLNQFFAKLLIRSKMLKEARYNATELNDMLATSFPQTMQLTLPGSEGELVVLTAELSMPLSQ